jgi:hypothetical protein
MLNASDLNPFKCRQAVEALRNGVPNRAAVEILGCNRPEVENRFDDLLLQVIDTETPPEGALGMLVSGDFGSGKSHLLSYLEHRALQEGFACSRVAISKETPLYQLGKVFSSAIQHARLQGRTGQLMEEIGDRINSRTQDYDRFSHWLNVGENGLHQYFPATLMVYERSGDIELRSEIESFWAGDSIRASRVREGLRLINQQGSFNFRAPSIRELPPQRLRFATELIKGAGYKGWVVLLDELELVSSYSLLQRARSYAELTRWIGKTTDEHYPGLVVVGTFTRGFESEVLGSLGKNDREVAANRLRERNEPLLAARADAAIPALEREPIPLQPPDEADLMETLAKLRQLYEQAYGWNTPAPAAVLDGAAYQNTMRYKIRACINEWDLRRLYPDVQPETEGEEFEYRYEEQPEMEEEVKDDA